MAMSQLEATLLLQIRAMKLPEPEIEYRFHVERRYRFDFCWPDRMLAAECEGGTFTNGRHSRGKGFHEDCIKYNLAAELGYIVLRYDAQLIKKGLAVQQLAAMLQ